MMSVPLPPHQSSSSREDFAKIGDAGGYFPTKESAQAYAGASAPYHRDRLRALEHLVSDWRLRVPVSEQENLKILDFGVGDGEEVMSLGFNLDQLTGIDVSPHMIELAQENLGGGRFTGIVGSVDELDSLHNASFDFGLCINVLGYVPQEKHDELFSEFARTIRPGGFLITMTGNVLIDLFMLNQGTAAFFEDWFGIPDVERLLPRGTDDLWIAPPRQNPLNWGPLMKGFGFREVKQSFSQWHRSIPALHIENHADGDASAIRTAVRDHSFDPNTLSDTDAWRALFQCSIFASLLQRT